MKSSLIILINFVQSQMEKLSREKELLDELQKLSVQLEGGVPSSFFTQRTLSKSQDVGHKPFVYYIKTCISNTQLGCFVERQSNVIGSAFVTHWLQGWSYLNLVSGWSLFLKFLDLFFGLFIPRLQVLQYSAYCIITQVNEQHR